MNEAETAVPRTQREIKFTEKNLRNFWHKVDKDGPTMPNMETPCWVWTAGKKPEGYGKFVIKPSTFAAHRISWMIHNGAIRHDGSAHGICVCHRCDNPSCVNPEHLFLGTNTDNIRDMDKKGRRKNARGDDHYTRLYPEKRPRGESHGCAKLTNSQVIEIRLIHNTKSITMTAIADMFKVDRKAISAIVHRKTWTHIP